MRYDIRMIGLTSKEVEERVKRGTVNAMPDSSSRSILDILRANICTRFNALILVLAIIVVVADRSVLNALFFFAMLLNIIIGVVQELIAKRTLDRLSILAKPKVTVIRDGEKTEIATNKVVQDDLVFLTLGDQIVVDGKVIQSNGLEVDESLLTGESEPVVKNPGDKLLSGSIIVAGQGVMCATKVGTESYSSKLSAEAKQFKRASSELVAGTNQLLKWISWLMLVVAPLLVWGQLRLDGQTWQTAVVHGVAALVGMIPEGLVLLTSAAFMLAAVKLAWQHVLIQQLPAVETLARVDTLLLDKTGTITEGSMKLDDAIYLSDDVNESKISRVLATIASRAQSPTNNAIAAAYHNQSIAEFANEVPFSSARKWSAIEIDGHRYIFGAPEVVLNAKSKVLKQAQSLAAQGKRVLVLTESEKWPDEHAVISKIKTKQLCLVVLTERVRSDAAKTLTYFAEQGVDIKVISGDSPVTVGAVANSVGIDAKIFDARDLPDPEKSHKKKQEFLEIVSSHNVFGRVQPRQKRQIADVLQQQGRVVAMTGDGVNDALALKKADLGIAMDSGSSATKAVAEVVLMDNKFSHLPAVLGEGRRVIANIERVSNLFVIKNVYSMVMALAVTVLGLTYPLLPAQMTVISTLSIGMPAFFLALAPNKRIYRPGFLVRVLRFAIPVGMVEAIAMMVTYYLVNRHGMSLATAGTSVSMVAMLIGMAVLVVLSRPIKGWKLALIAGCSLLFVALLFIPLTSGNLEYSVDLSTLPTVLVSSVLGVCSVLMVQLFVTHQSNQCS